MYHVSLFKLNFTIRYFEYGFVYYITIKMYILIINIYVLLFMLVLNTENPNDSDLAFFLINDFACQEIDC